MFYVKKHSNKFITVNGVNIDESFL